MLSAMNRPLLAGLLLIPLLFGTPAKAVDPLYEPELEQLSQVLGSLYFLGPLCP